MPNEAVTKYWLEHYVDDLCTLCGNWGVIDSRASATSPAGWRVGRLNFCICPNGQALREGNADIERVLINRH